MLFKWHCYPLLVPIALPEWGNSLSKCGAKPPASTQNTATRQYEETGEGSSRDEILSDSQGWGWLNPFLARLRDKSWRREGGGHYLCYLMAELPSLGPRRVYRHRNALQTAPGTTRGINTVPKQNQMFFQLWTGEHCDPCSGLGRSLSVTEANQLQLFKGLSKTGLFLCLTGATIPILRAFILLCMHLI